MDVSGRRRRRRLQVIGLLRIADLSLGWTGQAASVFPAAWSASVAVGTRIHVFGGSSGSGIVDTWESAVRQSNGVVSGWRPEGQIPQKLVGAVAVAKDGRVYLTGGFNGVRFQSTVYRWDTEDAVQVPVQPATLYRAPGARQQPPVADLPFIPAAGSVAIVSLATAVVLLIREHFQPAPGRDRGVPQQIGRSCPESGRGPGPAWSVHPPKRYSRRSTPAPNVSACPCMTGILAIVAPFTPTGSEAGRGPALSRSTGSTTSTDRIFGPRAVVTGVGANGSTHSEFLPVRKIELQGAIAGVGE